MGVLAILVHFPVASLPQQGFLARYPLVTKRMVILVGFPAMLETIYRHLAKSRKFYFKCEN